MSLLYNGVLVYLVRYSTVSPQYHEEFVRNKEIEYSYGINKTWAINRYYTFSSFKSGFFTMYHRVVFNVWSMVLIGSLVFMTKFDFAGESDAEAKGASSSESNKNGIDLGFVYRVNLVIVLVLFLFIGVLISVPYRAFSTNGIYVLGLSSIIVQLIFI